MRAGVAVCPTQKNANGKNKVCVNEGQIKMASVPAPRPRPSIDLVIPVRVLVQFLPAPRGCARPPARPPIRPPSLARLFLLSYDMPKKWSDPGK